MELDYLSLPIPELFGLIHEGFKAGQRVGLLLPIVGHVEDRDVMILLPIPFEQGTDDRPRHACKRHDIDDATCTPSGKINGLPDGEDCLSFKGRIQVRLRLSENRSCLGFAEVSEMASKYFLQMMFVFFLIIVGQENF